MKTKCDAFYEVQTSIEGSEVGYFTNIRELANYMKSLLHDNPSATLNIRLVKESGKEEVEC